MTQNGLTQIFCFYKETIAMNSMQTMRLLSSGEGGLHMIARRFGNAKHGTTFSMHGTALAAPVGTGVTGRHWRHW